MSLSLNFNHLWTGANAMINGLGPVYLIVIGFSFGIAILGVIAKAISSFRVR